MQYQAQPYRPPAQPYNWPMPTAAQGSYIPQRPCPVQAQPWQQPQSRVPEIVFPQMPPMHQIPQPVPQYQPYVIAPTQYYVPSQHQPCSYGPSVPAVQPQIQRQIQQPAPQQPLAYGNAPRVDPSQDIQYVSQSNSQPHFAQTECRRLAQQRDGIVDCQHPYQLYMDRQKK